MLHQTERLSVRPKVLLIEGWRGVSHSIALVNQHQILELLKLDGLKLYHHDLPFAFSHWTRTAGGSGFKATEYAVVEQVPPLPDDVAVDCVYRICAPIRRGDMADRRRTVTFMITEFGLGPGSFADGCERSDFFTQGENSIVTASEWSRRRLLDYGYAPEKVAVIPLGVDTTAFTPLATADRPASRAQMGFRPDETVFVNVGVALWNKGIDVLLRAFAALRARGRLIRLVLKDQRDIYGISIEQTLRRVGADCPTLLQPETLGAISVIPGKLERAQLRALYAIADAYVSPYRAEGFNLPVLEAIACGTPVIVTRGGATDDFCNDDVAWRIPGSERGHIDGATGIDGRYVEPDLDALIAIMDGLVSGGKIAPERYAASREDVLTRFTWANAAAQLATLTVGLEAPRATPSINAAAPNGPAQAKGNAMPFSELAFHQRLVRPGTIIDVGANIGRFSSHFSTWEHNRLIAFEPYPPTFERLRANITEAHGGKLPTSTTLHMAALGEAMGTARMRVPVVGNFLNHEWASLAKNFEGLDGVRVHEIEVPVWTIDGLGLDDVSAMKVDAEGYEIEVLQGARNTIARCRPIISCELEERHREGITWYIPGFMRGLGYDGWFYHDGQFWADSSLDRGTMQVASNSPAGSSCSDPYINEFMFVPRELVGLRQLLLEFGSFRS
jgi:FkbM family methyltransferase